MKLIVGLGNPGKEYKNTRHNVGFMVIENYISSNSLVMKEKFNGEYAEATIGNEKVIFLRPLSYMNLSGEVVYKFKDYFKIDIEDIFVIYDDISFELGTYKLKSSGSAGGHHGIENIIHMLKSENVKRMKIGISKNNKVLKNYVLGKFGITDRKTLKKVIDESYDIINDFCRIDFEKLMSKYNK